MRHLATHHISKNGSAARPGTWPRWCCDLDCAADPPGTLGLLLAALAHAHSICAGAAAAFAAAAALLLCCRRAKQEVQISSFTKRKGSRRTAPPPPPARRMPPSLFFLIWTPEENIYASVVDVRTASRTFRRRFGASLSLCPGFLQRHAARHHCRHR